MSDLVCANCGGDRLSEITKGIDNWPIGRCANCSVDGAKLPPEGDTSEKAEATRAKAVQSAQTQRKSKRAAHTKYVPLIPRDQWHPRVKPKEAPTIGVFD